MRGKYGHQQLKIQKLSNKISEKLLFGMDLKKPRNLRLYKGFSLL